MNNCFINGLGCVSAQPTLDQGFLKEVADYSGQNLIRAKKPNYKSFIPPTAIRRMGAGVKNSIVASKTALNEAGVEDPGAIVTGTGLGCIQDSEKFLNRMIDNDEQYLTPTSFIQSTHNTVAGQIALNLGCNAYNVTYVNAGASFPSALLDGQMKIEEGHNNIVVGGVDEISDYTTKLYRLVSHYKNEEVPPDILKERSVGCVPSEGATFFVLDGKPTSKTYAELVDVHYSNQLSDDGQKDFTAKFLEKNDLSFADIDAVLLGNNGDSAFDTYYDDAEKLFSNSTKLFYKHLFGEFLSSPSIGVWLAAKMLKTQKIPKELFQDKPEEIKQLKTVLVYNQYRGKDHSLMLLKNV